jgi:hypothetical protein
METTSPAGVISLEETNGGQLGALNVLVGTIIRPRATFTSLREMKQGYWWLVFLLTVAALVLYTVISASAASRAMQGFTPPVGVVTGGTAANMPQVTMQTSSFVTIAVPIATGIITLLVGYAFRGLIAFGASLIMGGHSTFKQTFRMAVWTTLPAFFRHIVHSTAVVTTQGRSVSGLTGVMTTMEARSLPILNLLLGQIDVYTVWSMVLLGIGIAATTRLSKGKSIITVLIYIAVSVAGLLLIYAVSSALGGLIGGTQQGPSMMRGPRG